jgi:hypothetical protein
MNAHIARRVARCMALPVVAAGIIIGGAALGRAGTANAAEGTWSYHPEPRTGIVAEPKTTAKPANGASGRINSGAGGNGGTGLTGALGGGGGGLL